MMYWHSIQSRLAGQVQKLQEKLYYMYNNIISFQSDIFSQSPVCVSNQFPLTTPLLCFIFWVEFMIWSKLKQAKSPIKSPFFFRCQQRWIKIYIYKKYLPFTTDNWVKIWSLCRRVFETNKLEQLSFNIIKKFLQDATDAIWTKSFHVTTKENK